MGKRACEEDLCWSPVDTGNAALMRVPGWASRPVSDGSTALVRVPRLGEQAGNTALVGVSDRTSRSVSSSIEEKTPVRPHRDEG